MTPIDWIKKLPEVCHGSAGNRIFDVEELDRSIAKLQKRIDELQEQRAECIRKAEEWASLQWSTSEIEEAKARFVHEEIM